MSMLFYQEEVEIKEFLKKTKKMYNVIKIGDKKYYGSKENGLNNFLFEVLKAMYEEFKNER